MRDWKQAQADFERVLLGDPPSAEPPLLDQLGTVSGGVVSVLPLPPTGGGGGTPDGLWDYHGTGLMLPRGTLVTSRCGTPEQLLDLTDRVNVASDRRGARRGDQEARRVRRSAKQEAMLDALCAFCESYGVDLMGVVSFRDEYASTHHINTLEAAIKDVHKGLRQMPMNDGKWTGTRERFGLAGEWHRTGREVPHVHLLLCSGGRTPKEVCGEVYRHFFRTRGRTRIEPILGLKGTRYSLKDVLKQSIEHPEALDLCTTKPKRVNN